MTDVIIVLGHLMSSVGVLSTQSAARADYAALVYGKMKGIPIITCGWRYQKDSVLTLAQGIQNYLISQHRVLASDILLQNLSRDTVGDAFFCKTQYCEPKNWRSILVVTSDYHVKRAKAIFEFIFGDAYTVCVEGVPSGYDLMTLQPKETDSYNRFCQTFLGVDRGNTEQIFARLQSRHPYYNGERHPKIERK